MSCSMMPALRCFSATRRPPWPSWSPRSRPSDPSGVRMRPPSSLLTLAALALLGAAPLAAQGASCAARGAKLPAAGAWAEYKTAEGNMRMVYLAKESAGERLEMSMSGQRGAMVMQMVVPGYPYEMTQIKELVMQRDGEPPMRLPESMLSMMRSRMPNASQVSEASCARMTEVGKERITV